MYSEVELLYNMVVLFSIIFENSLYCFLLRLYQFSFPLTEYRVIFFSTSSLTMHLFSNSIGERWYLIGILIWISLMISYVDYVPISHLNVFFKKNKVFCLFCLLSNYTRFFFFTYFGYQIPCKINGLLFFLSFCTLIHWLCIMLTRGLTHKICAWGIMCPAAQPPPSCLDPSRDFWLPV